MNIPEKEEGYEKEQEELMNYIITCFNSVI